MATGARDGVARSLEHPWWIVVVALAAGATATVVALREPVPRWELDLALGINDATDAAAVALYPVMQVGTIWAPFLAGALVLVVRRDGLLAAALVVGGFVAWFGAKGIKEVVERGRPLTYLPEIDVREGSGRGLGFVSGHSAVAMCTMVIVMAVVAPRWRPLLLVVALLVGLARVVVGVHLPADVVGGWAFGALVGVAVLEVVDRLRPRADRTIRREALA